jgi:hypothetical protein
MCFSPDTNITNGPGCKSSCRNLGICYTVLAFTCRNLNLCADGTLHSGPPEHNAKEAASQPAIQSSIHPSIYPSIHPSVRPSIHPSINQSINPSSKPAPTTTFCGSALDYWPPKCWDTFSITTDCQWGGGGGHKCAKLSCTAMQSSRTCHKSQLIQEPTPFILQYVSRQFHILIESRLSTECQMVFPLSIYSTLSFP